MSRVFCLVYHEVGNITHDTRDTQEGSLTLQNDDPSAEAKVEGLRPSTLQLKVEGLRPSRRVFMKGLREGLQP